MKSRLSASARAAPNTSAFASLDYADNPGTPEALNNLINPELAKLLGDKPGGSLYLIAKLRMTVDLPTPLGDLRHQIVEGISVAHTGSVC